MKPFQFTYDGTTLDYFSHPYNNTRHNERAIEIPIFWNYIQEWKGLVEPKQIMEIGNTLSHYYLFPHVIIDKWEPGNGVTNVDLLEFNTDEKFPFIFSISTLEHIGQDERPSEPDKCIKAIEKIRSLLEVGGFALISFPLAYNPFLDNALKDNPDLFDAIICMRRGKYNEWEQVALDTVWNTNYGPEIVDIGIIEGAQLVKRFHTHVVFGYLYKEEKIEKSFNYRH